MTYPVIELRLGDARLGASSRNVRAVINPATEAELALLPIATTADALMAVDAAAERFQSWSTTPAWQRGAVLHAAARVMKREAERYAAVVVLENGKPLHEAKAEIDAAAETLEWYGEEARRIYGRSFTGRRSPSRYWTNREPVGVVGLFTPWNFPVVTLVRKVAPALAAGCTVVAKPAEETPASAMFIHDCLVEAGLPAGAFNILLGEPASISETLIRSSKVAKISFTGSTTVGRQLAGLAGVHLKRTTMELGGHGPAIICGDVAPVWAAELAAAGKYRNAGQVCNVASRYIVDRRIYREFAARFAEIAGKLKVGDGLQPDTAMGPLSNHRRLAAMERFTAEAVDLGAKVLAGGARLGGRGFFYAPTVLSDVPSGAAIMCEEPFGPIAPIVPFDTQEEALKIANQTSFGLSGYVLTHSREIARDLVSGLRVRAIGVNSFQVAFPEAPLGGVNDSGWGLEGGAEGIEPYLNTKFVHEA